MRQNAREWMNLFCQYSMSSTIAEAAQFPADSLPQKVVQIPLLTTTGPMPVGLNLQKLEFFIISGNIFINITSKVDIIDI